MRKGLGAGRVHPRARAEDSSLGAEEQQLMERVVSRPNMLRACKGFFSMTGWCLLVRQCS